MLGIPTPTCRGMGGPAVGSIPTKPRWQGKPLCYPHQEHDKISASVFGMLDDGDYRSRTFCISSRAVDVFRRRGGPCLRFARSRRANDKPKLHCQLEG